MSFLAYVHPRSGSMTIQLILGGAAAVAVAGKRGWKRVSEAPRIRKPSEEQTPR